MSRVKITMKMGQDATMDGRLEAVQEVERRFDVIAAGPTGPIVLHVTYVKAVESQTIFGQSDSQALDVAGATFEVVYNEDESIRSITRDGREPPPSTLEFLVDDLDFLSDAGLTDRVAGMQRLEVGQGIPDTSTIAQAIPGMDPKTARFSAVMGGKEKFDGHKVGRMDLEFAGDITQGPMTITFDGDGDVLLDLKRGYLRRTLIEGPLTLVGAETMDNGMVVEFEGTGKMHVEQVLSVD